MSARSFLDTNVLVYTDDGSAPAKQRRALELFEEHRRGGTGVVSVQVLQEYFVAATRKLGVDARTARRKVELFSELDVVVPEPADVLAAIDLTLVRRLSFWDALVVRTAQQAGCSVLLTEDLQAGAELSGLLVVDPFDEAAAQAHERPARYRAARRGARRA